MVMENALRELVPFVAALSPPPAPTPSRAMGPCTERETTTAAAVPSEPCQTYRTSVWGSNEVRARAQSRPVANAVEQCRETETLGFTTAP